MIDPLEHYRYPRQWISQRAKLETRTEVERKIASGLFILSEDGWIRRGITTGTTACAALCGAISLEPHVKVSTPMGLTLELDVRVDGKRAMAVKFSGDHAFDATDGIEVVAERTKRALAFGRGIGIKRDGTKSVSSSVRRQLEENLERYSREYGYEGGVHIEVPRGANVAAHTDNPRLGIKDGISLLGSTGLVEPWGKRLVDTKLKIAAQYDKVVLTTGRRGWGWSRENLKGYQPFVFGVYLDEPLDHLSTQSIIIAGMPSLLIKWAMPELKGKLLGGMRPTEEHHRAVLSKAREMNEGVEDVVFI